MIREYPADGRRTDKLVFLCKLQLVRDSSLPQIQIFQVLGNFIQFSSNDRHAGGKVVIIDI